MSGVKAMGGERKNSESDVTTRKTTCFSPVHPSPVRWPFPSQVRVPDHVSAMWRCPKHSAILKKGTNRPVNFPRSYRENFGLPGKLVIAAKKARVVYRFILFASPSPIGYAARLSIMMFVRGLRPLLLLPLVELPLT